ncbi:MAG: ATPase [Marinilabiliales bacterium]|nr:MAG: ATPase [Marinilabiliales bacterium]
MGKIKNRVALPIENGMLCSHFGHCQSFLVYDIENAEILSEELHVPPPHEPGVLPSWLAEMGVTDIIAGGMGQRAIALFNEQKINVFIGVQIKDPEQLVKDYILGQLETTDNTCDH